MNRRQMMILPGVAAMAASQGLARPTRPPSAGPKSSLKKYTRPKALSRVPKTQVKTAKYLGRVAPLLALTQDQQEQAAGIFNEAAMTTKGLRSSLKTARMSLADAVKNGNRSLIEQVSANIGSLQAQRYAIAANAHAAFFQTLTLDQRSKLTQPDKPRA